MPSGYEKSPDYGGSPPSLRELLIVPIAALIIIVFLGFAALAVDSSFPFEVRERSKGIATIVRAADDCGFRRVLPHDDIALIKRAFAKIDRDAYLDGFQEGALVAKRSGFAPGTPKCQAAVPVLQRGVRGIVGMAATLREMGFE